MPARWLAAIFALSILVPACERLLFPPLARGSLAALAVLPWLLFASVPRRTFRGDRPVWSELGLLAMLSLLPLALGAGIDLARGAELRGLATACAAAWLAGLAWMAAAECAARRPAARAGFAALWLALLPGATLLCVALEWVPRRAGSDGGPLARLFALDPLVWCHRWGRADGLADPARIELVFVLGAAFLVLAGTLARAGMGPAPGAPERSQG